MSSILALSRLLSIRLSSTNPATITYLGCVPKIKQDTGLSIKLVSSYKITITTFNHFTVFRDTSTVLHMLISHHDTRIHVYISGFTVQHSTITVPHTHGITVPHTWIYAL